MGAASAPDIVQHIMVGLLGHLDYALVCIDDILIIQQQDETEEDHLSKIETVSAILENAGRFKRRTFENHSSCNKNSNTLDTFSH